MDIHWFSHEDFNLSWENAADKLSRKLSPIEPVLIVMDTLAKVMGLPDENSNSATAQVTRALYALNQTTHAALLLLAHPAKTVTKDTTVRGAGELSADLDVLWNIQRGPNQLRSARCEKDRDPDLENSRFDFSMETWKTGTRLVRHQPKEEASSAETAIFEALKAAGRNLIFLRETGEIAPAFAENGIPAPGQPHLTGVRDWSYDESTPSEQRGFKSAATVVLADGRKTDVYFAAERRAFTPQNSTILQSGPQVTG